ncbi:MAG: DUF1385 domain-containing protein [Nanobdellota archaeon]
MKKIDVGGQALIEGLMIKSPKFISVGVRKDGKIETKTEKYTSYTKRNRILGLPFIRGIVSLVEMLYIGMKELIYSANQQDEEEESLKPSHIILTIVLSLAFALLLFKAVPLLIAKGFSSISTLNDVTFNVIDGLSRIAIFLIYIVLISRMEDIKVMFQYHGAEHASIACYEHGEKLTPKNVLKHSTIHRRCGTNFIFLTLILSILIFSIVPTDLPYHKLLLLRLPLVLPIAGLSYEFLKLGAKKSRILRSLTMPGLWLQRITTKRPNKKQAEVAIATLKALLKKHGVKA